MFRVEVSYRDDADGLFSETVNIPCAQNVEDAKRIMQHWLAARCPARYQRHARLMDNDQEICSLGLAS